MQARKKHPRALRRWHKWVIGIGVGVAGTVLVVGALNVFVFTPVQHPMYGVSFSKKRAVELGLDWKANFTALAGDIGFKRFRLMSYWDESEPQRGRFDFGALDWQMDQAARYGAKVKLAIGLRQPRWPECHAPGWAYQLKGGEWKQALYAYIEVVVNRYKSHPALLSWELENEAVNDWFGTCDRPDRIRLDEEFKLVRQWDPTHHIIMSLSDQHGLPLRGPVPDEYGFSVYRVLWNDKIPPAGYIVYPTPLWYHRLRAMLIDWIQHRPIMIHELQMEPWGPRDTKDLSIEEQDKSMSIGQIAKNFDFARRIGASDIDTWGGEWWYWRKVQYNDDSIWHTVKHQVRR